MLSTLEVKILAGLGLMVALLFGIWAYNSHQQSIGAAQAKADAAAQALAGERAARAESDRRAVAIQQEANHADQAASAARADADSARSAADRLRLRLAAAERSRSASDPSATSASAPAGAAVDLYADVLGRTLEAARLIGAFADASRIAGLACQQSYSSLTP